MTRIRIWSAGVLQVTRESFGFVYCNKTALDTILLLLVLGLQRGFFILNAYYINAVNVTYKTSNQKKDKTVCTL